MTDTIGRYSFRSGVIALALAASVQLASADEMSTILGGGCEGQYCFPAANSGNTFIGLTQTGGQNATGIAQTGNYNSVTLNQPGGASASVTQTGNYLGLTLTQGQNTSIGVTQFGSGSAGAPPVTINTVK